MNHPQHITHFALITLLLGFVFIILASYLLTQASITGEVITAQAGNITQLNIHNSHISQTWVGVWGLLQPQAASNHSFTAGQVIELNLSYEELSEQTLIAATTNPELDWSTLSPAQPLMVDDYLELSPTVHYSASNTYTELHNFTINNVIYELWSARMNSHNGSYITGILNSSNDLIFVTYAQLGTHGFQSQTTHYQLLLPITQNEVNYSFFVFEEDQMPGTGLLVCNQTANLTAQLHTDNTSILLQWDEIAGAQSYEIHYVEGPTNGYLNFSNASIVEVGTNYSYIDASNPQERYYKLAGVSGTSSCLVPGVVGTLQMVLRPDYNMVSFPFVGVNNSIPETLRSMYDSLYALLEFDNVAKGYRFYIVSGENVFRTPGYDDVVVGRGHWLRVTQDTTLILAGNVVNSSNMSLTPDYNMIGFPPITNSDHNASIPYVLSSMYDSLYALLEFDNVAKGYRFYIVSGENVFRTPGYDDVVVGRGHWLRVTEPTTFTYENELT